MRYISTPLFEWSFRSRVQSTIFLLVLALFGLFVGGEAVRVGIAETLAASSELNTLRWALALDPANPRIHKLMGLYFCYLESPDLAEGITHLRRAIELDPLVPNYWYSLASACELAGYRVCADQAFERAISLGPVVPRFQWAAANHYLLTDRTTEALSHLRRLLELDPSYDWATFRLCLRLTGDSELVFKQVLPAKDTKLKLDYVNFLSAEGKPDSAYQAWVKTVADASAFPVSSVEPYLDRLLAQGRGQEARSVWHDLQRLGVVTLHEDDVGENLIFNGDFEQSPLNAGLDWRYLPTPYLSVDFSAAGAYHGKRCLRLDFTVNRNDDYTGVFQFVPVVPNHEYLLQAYTRSENITSDSGPRLRVFDPACLSCVNVMSDSTVGTTPWHQVSLRFSTGPQTQLVNLSVLRLRGRTFPTEITGSFWMDAVSIKSTSSGSDHADLMGPR